MLNRDTLHLSNSNSLIKNIILAEICNVLQAKNKVSNNILNIT